MSFLRQLTLLVFLGALSVVTARAAGNVVAGTPTFTARDGVRTYMDAGGVWSGTANVFANNGDTITIVYTNTGNTPAYNFAPQVVLPTGFSRIGNSATFSAAPATISGTPGTTGTVTFNLNGYDIPAGGTVTLTFRIRAAANVVAATYQLTHGWRWSEVDTPSALNTLTTTLQNILVQRGNAVVYQSPATLTRAVNASGTFTYTIQNTGLGGLFSVTFNEAASNPAASWDWDSYGTITSPRTPTTSTTLITLSYLAPGESIIIPVNGHPINCVNIENLFTVGDATNVSGVSYFSPVTLDLTQPLLSYTGPSITLAYGTTVPVSIAVQNTGAGSARGIDIGGGTRAIRLTTNFPALGVTISSVATNWAYNSTTGTFDYTGNSGVIANATTQTLTFNIRATDDCAASPSGTIVLGSQYENLCGSAISLPTVFGSLTGPPDKPTVSLTKTASASRLAASAPGTFTLTLSDHESHQDLHRVRRRHRHPPRRPHERRPHAELRHRQPRRQHRHVDRRQERPLQRPHARHRVQRPQRSLPRRHQSHQHRLHQHARHHGRLLALRDGLCVRVVEQQSRRHHHATLRRHARPRRRHV
jgi:hypothetical protein